MANNNEDKKISRGKIVKISGPLVVASGMRDVSMFELVRVGNIGLAGEVIEVHGDEASIQVYEETHGLKPGEPVVSNNYPLSVELGPGLMGNIYDGIQRPLELIKKARGSNLPRGININAIDHEKKWHFVPRKDFPEFLRAGDTVGSVQENNVIEHKIMLSPNIPGDIKVLDVAEEGDYTVVEPIAKIQYTNNWGDEVT